MISLADVGEFTPLCIDPTDYKMFRFDTTCLPGRSFCWAVAGLSTDFFEDYALAKELRDLKDLRDDF